MIKALHVHSDPKFVHDSSLYLLRDVEVRIVYIGKNYFAHRNEGVEVIELKKTDAGITSLYQMCETVDIIFLFNLDAIKAGVANRFGDKKLIFWRFFGNEFYKWHRQDFVSDLTDRYVKYKPLSERFMQLYWHSKITLYNLIYKKHLQAFSLAVRKVNFVIGICKEEHDFINQNYMRLPEFIQVPFPTLKSDKYLHKKRDGLVIVGHNRNPYNNHLDILSMLDEKLFERTILPLAYGSPESAYLNQVTKTAKIKGIQILENFIPYEEYQQLYAEATVYITNTVRQIGFGNTRMAIEFGLKIYMNRKNVIFSFLKNLGVKIYPLETFAEDQENDNLVLSPEVAKSNIENFNKYYSCYGEGVFPVILRRSIYQNAV